MPQPIKNTGKNAQVMKKGHTTNDQHGSTPNPPKGSRKPVRDLK